MVTSNNSIDSNQVGVSAALDGDSLLAYFLAACVQRDVVDPVKLLSGEEMRTTLMIRRLPRTITESDLYLLLGPSMIDCVYIPLFRTSTSILNKTKNRGFGFVNFVSPVAAAIFVQSLALYGEVFAKSEIVFAHVQGKHNMSLSIPR
jgi:hypothetical protein